MLLEIHFVPFDRVAYPDHTLLLTEEGAEDLANKLFEQGVLPKLKAATEEQRITPELSAWFRRLALDELKRVLSDGPQANTPTGVGSPKRYAQMFGG